MTLKDMIYRRKSVRSYTGKPVEEALLEKIQAYTRELKPLYPEITVHAEIVNRDQVKCFLPWTTPQLIAIYSEEAEGYLENAGFMFQQLDLYLQSIGLGSCWLGMGRINVKSVDNLSFVILIAFGYPKGEALRSDVKEFKRKTLSQIADREDVRLEPARLAPSSVNSQPWYFTHEEEWIHAYCALKGLLKLSGMGYMNRIDMGIALAHMYAAYPETFRFAKLDGKGKGYIGSFMI